MTKNFSKSEFESKCGREMPEEVYHNVVKVANQLQYLRDYLNKPIKVNSAYRSPEHNAKVGGVPKSQHLLGKAADIVVSGIKTEFLYQYIEDAISNGEMLQGGLGLYDTFVHYDIRGTKARWDYRKK
ncbi:Uncharacterized protein conserved in bacteria (COG3108) [uncultured Mediterranean phage uvMED]|nr:Uncharacterized protein conserved in bacteria (COG3108) [uncultured Mediterranean phage uvMED]|tara:strand:+ start:1575 stop:1955 length:381 start_codon:yes stop_codon:yes gene_type:complete